MIVHPFIKGVIYMKLNRLIATAGAFLFAGLVGSQSAVAKLNEDFSYEEGNPKLFSENFQTIDETGSPDASPRLVNIPQGESDGKPRTEANYQAERVEGAEVKLFAIAVTDSVEGALIKANQEGRVYHHIWDGAQSYTWADEKHCPGIAFGVNHLSAGCLMKAIPIAEEGYVIEQAGIDFLKEIVSGKDISDVKAIRENVGWQAKILNLTENYCAADGTTYKAVDGLKVADSKTITSLKEEESSLKAEAKKKAAELEDASKE
ncbi:MAG: hypothetical protein ACPG7U_03980 [Holosporaceae bacterium]